MLELSKLRAWRRCSRRAFGLYVYGLTISSTESFARDIISTHPTVGPGVGDEMAASTAPPVGSVNVGIIKAKGMAALFQEGVWVVFMLPTGGAVEAITTAHIPAPTRIGPTIPAEGHGNVVWKLRAWRRCSRRAFGLSSCFEWMPFRLRHLGRQ
jgi:hypothetical protein